MYMLLLPLPCIVGLEAGFCQCNTYSVDSTVTLMSELTPKSVNEVEGYISSTLYPVSPASAARIVSITSSWYPFEIRVIGVLVYSEDDVVSPE